MPDKCYYSFKKKIRGPALHYEVAVSILSSDIMWIAGVCLFDVCCCLSLSIILTNTVICTGPFLPGVLNDLSVFRTSGIREELGPGERIEADDVYQGESPECTKCPCSMGSKHSQKRMKRHVHARHETINHRLKCFASLDTVFDHSSEKHGACFCVAAICTNVGDVDIG